MKNKIRSIASRGVAALTGRLDSRKLADIVYGLAYSICRNRSANSSLLFLLELERQLFLLTGAESCRYGDGLHSKHRHTRYHDFFTSQLCARETVLDIGCGNGSLAYDMACVGANVVAIDLNRDSIHTAQQNFAHPNIEYIHGDALRDLPDRGFHTVVMSNVLEHIEFRVEFLMKIQVMVSPKRYLIRVPLYERDWRVPLMEELGVDYRLDATHFIEYKNGQFSEEMGKAGLQVVHMDHVWGEIWSEVQSTKPTENQ